MGNVAKMLLSPGMICRFFSLTSCALVRFFWANDAGYHLCSDDVPLFRIGRLEKRETISRLHLQAHRSASSKLSAPKRGRLQAAINFIFSVPHNFSPHVRSLPHILRAKTGKRAAHANSGATFHAAIPEERKNSERDLREAGSQNWEHKTAGVARTESTERRQIDFPLSLNNHIAEMEKQWTTTKASERDKVDKKRGEETGK